MRKVFTSILLLASTLAACTGANVPFVYKIDIPQGNIVTQDMVSQLERGMDKQRVTYILGTPLLMDVFHQNRWDYVYSFTPGGGKRQGRRISLYFENDRLVRIEGDIKPAETEGLLTEDAATPSAQKRTGENGDLIYQLGVEAEEARKPIRP